MGLGAKATAGTKAKGGANCADYTTHDNCDYDDDVEEAADSHQAYNDLG